MKTHLKRYELNYNPSGNFEITKWSDDLENLKAWLAGRLKKNKNPFFAGIYDNHEEKWVYIEHGVV